MPEADGIALKVRWLHTALASIGATPVLERSGPSLGYRNRNIYHVVADIDGLAMLASRVPAGAELADMVPCVAVLPAIDAAASRFVRELSEAPQTEWPRYLVLRGNRAGEVVGELIFGRAMAAPPAWTEQLAERLGWAGWGWSVNEDAGDAVRRGEPVWAAGAASVMERYGRLDLPIGTAGFAQLNAAAAGAMYELAGSWLAGAETVWDLYCGMGAIGLHGVVVSGVSKLFGAESGAASIEAARSVAATLPVQAKFEVMTAAEAFAAGWERPDAVVVNPPRKGLEPAVLAGLLALRPVKLIYMSCNPDSFARDASRLMADGYRLDEVSAHDLLPQTRHAELLARFSL
jgi:tRNA/tmRNA/rRNA uracil-C5-methylase (TrmA/RlmC/RlmD family)